MISFKISIIWFLGCIFYYSSSAQSTNILDNKFVIVLDVQDYFVSKYLTDSASESLIDNSNAIIRNADQSKVIYVRTNMSRLSVSRKGIKAELMPDLDFDKRLNLVNKSIFVKSSSNAFTSAEMTKYLQKNGAKDIVVIGLLAEQCVLKTVFGGKAEGYNMHIVPQAIAGKSEKSKENVIEKLINNEIQSISMEQINAKH